MAAINFPNSPTVGDTYAANGTTFQWDGVKWKVYSVVPDDALFNSVKLDDGTSGQAGTLSWNTDDGTLDLVMSGGGVVQQIGLEQFYRVKNQSGVTIANGTPVYINGVVGNSGHVTVLPMLADGTIPSKRFIGIATETITNGNDGYVTSFGYVRSLDTTGTPYTQTWANGDIIYVSQTAAGGLTNVQPTTGLVLPVAVVINAHQSVGTLLVRSGPAISATAEDGVLARTALQSGDNVSELANDAGYATQSQVTAAVAAVVDAAPAALDTLNELAAALGDDANFASTVTASLAAKQATLVSNTNIKTVNSTSLLGSGNVAVQPTLVSGTNIKTVNSTSLVGSGDVAVQPTLVSGTNIKTVNSNSLLGSGNISITAPEANTTSPGTVYGVSATYNTQVSNSGNSGVGRGVSLGTDNCYGNSFVGADVNIGSTTHNSVAIGRAARIDINSASSVVVGETSRIFNNSSSSIAIGGNAYVEAYKPQSVVLGHSARSSGPGSIVIGSRAWAQGTNSIRIGKHNQNTQNALSGSGSIGIGHEIGDNGYNIIAFNSDPGTGFSPSSDGFYVNNVTSASTSNVLYYDTNTKKITYGAPAGGDLALDGLSDVTITSPTSGQVLKYNGTAWVNGTAGEEPPPVADVYRSTLIVPLDVFQASSTTMYVQFSTPTQAAHVRAVIVAIANALGNGIVSFYRNGQQYPINFNSNASSWITVSGATLTIQNYNTYNNSSTSLPNQIQVRAFPQQVSLQPPGSTLLVGGNSLGTALTAAGVFDVWKPFGIEFYQGNFAPSAGSVAPNSSPTLTPAVTALTAPAPGTAEFALDTTNNPIASFGVGSSPTPYVKFTLGTTVLVDPNAPVPWYTVQGAQGSNPINGSIALPAGYDSAQLGSGHKFVGIGNCHNFSGGSQYFYPYGPGMTSGPSIGSAFSNNQSRTYFTTSGMSSPVSYDQQGLGIVSVFAQPIPSNSGALCAYTKGNTSYAGPPGGFFGEYFSGYLVNNNPGSPPSGGTVKFKSVMIFNNPVTVELFSTYASASGILLETFNYTDQYYGNTTRYVFLTCTNDTVARQMAADTAPILEFKNSPGGSNSQVTHLAWSWFERTV